MCGAFTALRGATLNITCAQELHVLLETVLHSSHDAQFITFNHKLTWATQTLTQMPPSTLSLNCYVLSSDPATALYFPMSDASYGLQRNHNCYLEKRNQWSLNSVSSLLNHSCPVTNHKDQHCTTRWRGFQTPFPSVDQQKISFKLKASLNVFQKLHG